MRPPTLCEACHRPPKDHGFKTRRKRCLGCNRAVCPECATKKGPGNVPLECAACEGDA